MTSAGELPWSGGGLAKCGDCCLDARSSLASRPGWPAFDGPAPPGRPTHEFVPGSRRWFWRPTIQRAKSVARRRRAVGVPPLPRPGSWTSGRWIATATRLRRIYGIVNAMVLATAVFSHPASGQDRQLPDFTTIPTHSIADAPEDIREIIFTAVCHLPETARDPERGEDSLLPLVVFADTAAFELTEYESCRNRMDLSGIKRMEFIHGSQAVRMYGERAGAGVLRVFPKTLTSARRTGTRLLRRGSL